MIHIHRTLVALTVLALFAPGFNRLARSQTSASPGASKKTFIISGSVGVAGVVMKGLPSEPITDADGNYSASVPYRWKGKVTPLKQGYAFEPPSREYAEVAEDRTNEDYEALVLKFTISGKVGVADVMLKGLPDEVVSDADGSYSAELPYGWAGVVAPWKEGYTFTPASRSIAPIKQNQTNVNFTGKVKMVTITDEILLEDEPIQGVRVTAEPGGSSAFTDARGRYTIQVPYGWSGELFLAKEGFDFDPPSIRYDNVTENIDHVASDGPVPPSGAKYPRVTAPDAADDVLVIPTTGVSPVQFTEIAEDMRVMLDILREKLSEPRTISGVLYDYGDFFKDSKRTAEALYLQGHGVIFMMKADFPLSPPTAQGQAEPQKAEPADPVWQRARDRLYAPQGARPYGSRPMSREAEERSFDQLKEELIKTLKHAANIRNIDPNEWIILTVTGRSGTSFAGGFGMGMMGGMGGYGGGGATGGVAGYGRRSLMPDGSGRLRWEQSPDARRGGASAGRAAQTPASPVATTLLTIQAKKADIDALAGGSVSFERFQEKVKVFTY